MVSSRVSVELVYWAVTSVPRSNIYLVALETSNGRCPTNWLLWSILNVLIAWRSNKLLISLEALKSFFRYRVPYLPIAVEASYCAKKSKFFIVLSHLSISKTTDEISPTHALKLDGMFTNNPRNCHSNWEQIQMFFSNLNVFKGPFTLERQIC